MRDLTPVLSFIEQNLDADLDGETLSSVAGLSRFHFHRTFSRRFGISARSYVELLRVRRAAFRLAFRPQQKVLDIALDSGFESHEAFSRAFKRALGQTPSAFRREPCWDKGVERARVVADLRRQHLSSRPPGEVRVEWRPEVRIVGLHHRPERGSLLTSARRFIEWRRRERLPPRINPTFNVMRRGGAGFAFCVGTDREVALEADMFVGSLPKGRCAVLRHVGDEDSLRATAAWLAVDWVRATAHAPRNDTLVFQRVELFPDVAEREAITDVILPLR